MDVRPVLAAVLLTAGIDITPAADRPSVREQDRPPVCIPLDTDESVTLGPNGCNCNQSCRPEMV
jgi:hypothetical protein